MDVGTIRSFWNPQWNECHMVTKTIFYLLYKVFEEDFPILEQILPLRYDLR